MRPYIAIIKDSFREALASRVLVILLVLTTIVLLAIAPLGIQERAAWQLQPHDILDMPRLIAQIRTDAQSTAATPGKRLWGMLDADLRKRLEQLPAAQTPGDVLAVDFLAGLNAALANRDLFDAAAWRNIELTKEASELLATSPARLSHDELRRLNRLLVDAAFRNRIAPATGREAYLRYLVWDLAGPLYLQKSEIQYGVNYVLTLVMSFFVGVVGVFAAVLVTSTIIPHTFDAGAIDLLLSKPVARSLLFLTKFAGGCAFIVLNAGYFIGGLWLIVGLRFNSWSPRLLLCIPIFLFLFAVYYSVSAFAGVVWRNAVVSVVMTVLFWLVCFGIGTTKGVIENLVLNPSRLVDIVPAGAATLSVNDRGLVLQWQSADRTWGVIPGEPALQFGATANTLGPAFDVRGDRLFAIRRAFLPGSGFPQEPTLFVARRAAGWRHTEGPRAPLGTVAVFANRAGEAILVAEDGVHRWQGEVATSPRRYKLLTFEFSVAGSGSSVNHIGPEPRPPWSRSIVAAMNAETGDLAVWQRGRLNVLEPDPSGRYHRRGERLVEAGTTATAIAFSKKNVLVGLSDGRLLAMDAVGLNQLYQSQPERKNPPQAIKVSPDGRWFAVLFQHGVVWVLDAEGWHIDRPAIVGQEDVSAIAFVGPNRLMAADRGQRVTEYELSDYRTVRTLASNPGTLESFYRYVLNPLYTVFPKPGELDNTIMYLLTERETVSAGMAQPDGRTPTAKLNVWGPVWSSLGFMVGMLLLTCLYVHRRDF